jgi:hypothetical protein
MEDGRVSKGSRNKGQRNLDYFFAVQAGLNQNYELMEKIFGEVIAWTLRQRRQPYR